MKVRRIIFGISFMFLLKIAVPQDTTKVLFVGNSFTYFNDLPMVFQQLSKGAGKTVVVGSLTPGGVSVGDTAQGTSAHMNNPLLYDLIRSDNWDYLVLQDNQGRFVNNYGVFPSNSKVIEGHIRIRDSLIFYHPCAKMLWFAGWGPKSGYPPYASTGVGLIDKIYNNYLYLLDTAGQVIAPIGPAWKRIISNHPSINLWDSDDTHPGPNGTFLTATVIFSTIFKTSSIISSFVATGVVNGDDTIFKNTGFQTVMDSMDFTGLNTITPEITRIGNTLYVNGFNSCDWFLNGNFIASNNGNLTINQLGIYSVNAYTQNACEFKTLDFLVTQLNSMEEKGDSFEMQIFPNPSDGEFTIEISKENCKLQIFNSLGLQVYALENLREKEQIDLSSFQKGVYFLRISNNFGEIKIRKLILN